MKKKQAQEYYEQLKKIERAKGITLAEIINILTGGDINTNHFKSFSAYVASNQFGEYNHVEQYIKQPDWRQLEFSQVYQILKALKDYLVKHKTSKSFPIPEQIDHSNKESSLASFSPRSNNTLSQILKDLKQIQTSAKAVQSEEQVMEEKWKKHKIKLIKKLLVIFDFFRKNMYIEGETFQKNRSVAEHFDITLFMKYFKMFELSAAFQAQKAIKCFKKNALNTIWLDFDRFVNLHIDLIGFSESLNNKEKYLRLRGFSELLSSQKMKKMLNVRMKHIVANIVQGHTGTYKQDIINYLQEKQKERQQKIQKKYNYKSIKTEPSEDVRPVSLERQNKRSQLKQSQSAKSISTIRNRTKTQTIGSVYEQLKLPKLRIKQHRQQSIYKSLNQLNLSNEQEKMKKLVNVNQDEQFLNQYLKEQEAKRQRSKLRPKREVQLPPMRFS